MKLYLLWYKKSRTSLVAHWIRLHVPNAGGLGSIPGQGTRFHIPRLKTWLTALKPSAAK